MEIPQIIQEPGKPELKKRKIAVLTTGRADFGLLRPTIDAIRARKKLELIMIATGAHLSGNEPGTNFDCSDGLRIDAEVPCIVSGTTKLATAQSTGLGIINISSVLERTAPDILLLLGDRFETLAAACAAVAMSIPIAHISGGEITMGAIDNQIRHMISKASHIHFPGAQEYARNLSEMGEDAHRIFCVGDPGIELVRTMQFIPKVELFKQLELDLRKRTILATLHPTTLQSREKERLSAEIFFGFLAGKSDCNVVVTLPNSDHNSDVIVEQIRRIEVLNHVKVFKTLGNRLYSSLMKVCDLVMGNSSSGIIEAPFLKVPVIDCGDRQKGRLKADNILTIPADTLKLEKAFKKATQNKAFQKSLKNVKSLYGSGNTGSEIARILSEIVLDRKFIEKRL